MKFFLPLMFCYSKPSFCSNARFMCALRIPNASKEKVLNFITTLKITAGSTERERGEREVGVRGVRERRAVFRLQQTEKAQNLRAHQ